MISCRSFSYKKFIAIDIWLLTQGETFSISTTLTQPFHRARLKCLPLCLPPQETLRLRKTEPQLSKKKPALQYCGGQSCHNLSGCRGHHFEPHRVRFFDWVRPRFKSGGQLQKNTTKKPRKPTLPGSSTRKFLTRFVFISGANLSTKKPSSRKLKMVDDFISYHCMEIPAKMEVKYRKHFTAV